MSDVVAADLDTLQAAKSAPGWRELPVTGRLEFSAVAGDERAARLSGELDATLLSVCQRCLQPFEWHLATTIGLLLVEPGDTGRADDGLEVWELDGSDARALDIVDEALVMAMPLSVRHEDPDDCVDPRSGRKPEFVPDETGARTSTPFAGLAEQMSKETED